MNRPTRRGCASDESIIIIIGLAVWFALGPLLGLENGWSQESEHYKIDDLNIVSASGQASSGRFEALLTFAAGTPAGSMSSCNNGFGASLGFGSAPGDPPVPNSLFVVRDQQNPTQTVLSWSGTSDLFEVYRSTSRQMVVAPSNLLATTTSCFALDGEPMVGSVVYYNVIPAQN